MKGFLEAGTLYQGNLTCTDKEQEKEYEQGMTRGKTKREDSEHSKGDTSKSRRRRTQD